LSLYFTHVTVVQVQLYNNDVGVC